MVLRYANDSNSILFTFKLVYTWHEKSTPWAKLITILSCYVSATYHVLHGACHNLIQILNFYYIYGKSYDPY
jgi:hypothetical protein